jgi:transcriptional regulator with AAA-type ATPase domain/tetratricopeptide (TPR) repeat protein
MEDMHGLIGHSPALEAVRVVLRRLGAHAGPRLPNVLIAGETGTGKGLVARLIHRMGPRADGPFVDVNCAAIPETLLEAELFGFERGAFTDARRAKPGLIETAHGGTMFLDEIGLLSATLQAKLLKVTEEHAVRRLGATRSTPVSARLVCATNLDLAVETREGRFREDLYHRLAVVTLTLPPLRERGEDILLLAEHFLGRACQDYGLPARVLAPDARRSLLAHAWRGNVRELANLMERVALMAESTYVTARELGLVPAEPDARPEPAPAASLEAVTLAHVQAVVDECGGNLTRAAAVLGIARNTLRSYLRRSPPRPAAAAPAGRGAAPARPPVPARAPAPGPTPGVPLRWEARLVAVVATTLAAPPEIADYQLAPIVQELIATVQSFGGCVEELTPVGLVAAFGLDQLEDGPRRAAYAALAMRKSVERGTPLGQPVEVRCAVDVVRCLVAQGGAVGMDARVRREVREGLEGLLRDAPGGIVVAARAAAHLERRFELVPAAGEAGAAGALELVGRERSGLEVGGRTLSRFVGRAADLVALAEGLARAQEGEGRIVGIVGEAGVGKSRLLYEVHQQLLSERARLLRGRCLPYGPAAPYLPVMGLIRDQFGLDEDADAAAAAVRLREGLEALGLAARDGVPYLLHLLGFREGTEALAGQGPEAVRRGVIDTLREVWRAASRRQPLVCAVEDLHWIDQASEAVLEALAEACAASPVLVLVTYRPGYRPPWLGRPYALEHPLRRLDPDEARAVLESIAPGLAPALAERVVARADGVPLFLEELAHTLGDQGAAALDAVPDTLQGVLEARLERLGPDDRALLQTMSVIGRDVPLRILAEVADRPADQLEETLGRLRAAEFIHDADGGTAQVYRFKHSLTQEVTYRSLPEPRRRELHGAIGRALERVTPELAERQPELLARHYAEAGQAPPAVRYWQRAGALARQRAAYAEAVEQLGRGLALLPALPPGGERDQLELGLLVSLGISQSATQGFASAEVRRTQERARELCRRVGAGPLLLGALGGLCQFYFFRAEFDAARDLAEQHLATVQATGELNRLCASYDALGYIAYHLGELHGARAHLEKSLDLYDTIPRPPGTSLAPFDIAVSALGGLAVVCCLLGEGEQALHHARQAVERAGRLAPRVEAFSLAYAHTCASRVHLLRRETEAAAAHAHQAIEIGQAHGFATPVLDGRLALALTQILDSPAGGGTRLLAGELEAWRRGGYELDVPFWLAGLAEGHRREGDVAGAAAALRAGIEHAERHRERVWTPELYRLRAEVALLRAPADEEGAAADLEEALGIARAQGARLFELRSAIALHRLRLAQGRDRESRTLLGMVVRDARKDMDPQSLDEARALLGDTP